VRAMIRNGEFFFSLAVMSELRLIDEMRCQTDECNRKTAQRATGLRLYAGLRLRNNNNLKISDYPRTCTAKAQGIRGEVEKMALADVGGKHIREASNHPLTVRLGLVAWRSL